MCEASPASPKGALFMPEYSDSMMQLVQIQLCSRLLQNPRRKKPEGPDGHQALACFRYKSLCPA